MPPTRKFLERILGDDRYRDYAQRWVEANRRAGCAPAAVSTDVFFFEQSKKLSTRFPEAALVESIKIDEYKAKLPSVSLVVTLKNESASIGEWIESLSKQSLLPSELILVDASPRPSLSGSTKQRLEAVVGFEALKIFHQPGSNIAAGRNFGVENATGEIVAFTDLGCVLTANWLERLVLPFALKPEIQLSAGWYEPVSRTAFASSFAAYTVPRIEDIDPSRFIASARSFAIKRDLFKILRGFPAYLTFAGEDSLFGYHAKFLTQHAAFVPDAVVRWQTPQSAVEAFSKTFHYAAGDAEGGRIAWRHYLDLVLASPYFIFYVLRYPMRGNAPRLLQVRTVGTLLSAQLTGFVRGYLRRRSIFRRRIASHKLVMFLLTDQPFTLRNARMMADFNRLIELDYFIVNVYSLAGAAEVKAEKVIEHQQLLSFLRIEFNPERFFSSIGDSIRKTASFAVVDKCGDGPSQELTKNLETFGVKFEEFL